MPYQYIDENGNPGTDPATQTMQVPVPPVLQTQTETPEQKYARLYQAPQQTASVVTAPVIPQEVLDTLNSLKSELAGLKESVTKPVEPPSVAAGTPPVWVDKIRSGDFTGATAALASEVERTIQPRLAEVRTQAYQDALSATQVNIEIDRHVQQVRSANPDLSSFERYIQAPVAQRVEEAKAAGKIKSPADFVREYNSAIDAEVAELRNLSLVLRGQGRQEAQTRNQQVLASTTLVPNQVQSTQTQEVSQQTAPDESVESYFARRKADENRRRGLSL